jgi:hypothetical protein
MWEYTTASGKGKWTVFTDEIGSIHIKFDGYRNSFLSSNSLFSGAKVSPGIAAKNLTCGNLSIRLPGQAYLNLINGHLAVESSKPDVPLLEEIDTVTDGQSRAVAKFLGDYPDSYFVEENKKNWMENVDKEPSEVQSYLTEDGDCFTPMGLETLKRIGYPKTDSKEIA